MGLTLTALPDPHSQIESLQRALYEKIQRIADLEEDLQRAKAERAALGGGVANLRIALAPLYQALQMVFGHLDAMPARTAQAPPGGAKKAVWESWKEKLRGMPAKAIDILLMHGPMTSAQLRIQLACATRTCTNAVSTLKRAGLIEKVDGKISLKEL
jgi:hypothetical protein